MYSERRSQIIFVLKICSLLDAMIYGDPDRTQYVNIYYRQVSNKSVTLVGNKIVDHPDVVGASPVGAAPTTSSFST